MPPSIIARAGLLLALAIIVTPVAAAASAKAAPVTINFVYEDLVQTRAGLKSGIARAQPAAAQLFEAADTLLQLKPASVMDKLLIAPSGDKHDFYAMGNYSWPNPDTPDGLPYIRRDGYKNPEAREGKFDKGAFNNTFNRVNILALAWFYSGNEAYAAKAATLLRTWFIDPATRMNPNLQYAAVQPGVHEGHYGGIIESVVLIEMLDYVQLLTQSASWTTEDNDALKAWFANFTTWLLESDFGKKEGLATNNHGSWHSAQVAVFSLYSGDTARVKQMTQLARKQIDQQVAKDGSLPRELARSNAFMYTVYGMRAFTALARCGESVGDDLWHYQTPDGRGLSLAFAFLAPYLGEEKPWSWPRLSPSIDAYAIQIARLAARTYQTPELFKAADHLATVRKPDDRITWLLGATPLPAGSVKAVTAPAP